MSVNPSGPVSTNVTSGTQVQRDNTMLGKDDFLKILVGELQNMDPMSQSNDPTQSMAQMTQFSILEQITNLSSSQSTLTAGEKQSQAISLLGKTVDYKAADGSDASGAVQKVDFASDGSISLTIDGHTGVSPSSVSGVQ
jgi:flagellar basal-body rod modification protein FlgD